MKPYQILFILLAVIMMLLTMICCVGGIVFAFLAPVQRSAEVQEEIVPDPNVLSPAAKVYGSSEGNTFIELGVHNQSNRETGENQGFEGRWQLLENGDRLRAEGWDHNLPPIEAGQMYYPIVWSSELPSGEYQILWGSPLIGSLKMTFVVERDDQIVNVRITSQETRETYPPAFVNDLKSRSPEGVTENFYRWYMGTSGLNAEIEGTETLLLADKIMERRELTPSFIMKTLDELASSSGNPQDPIVCMQEMPVSIEDRGTEIQGSTATVRLLALPEKQEILVELTRESGEWKINNILCEISGDL